MNFPKIKVKSGIFKILIADTPKCMHVVSFLHFIKEKCPFVNVCHANLE